VFAIRFSFLSFFPGFAFAIEPMPFAIPSDCREDHDAHMKECDASLDKNHIAPGDMKIQETEI
jgi:hypothetical protein